MRHFRSVAIAIVLVALTACGSSVKTIDVVPRTLARTPPVIAPTAVPACESFPPDSYRSANSLLVQEGNTITDTLAVNMLRVFLGAGRGSDRLYVGGMWTDFFGIEITTDTVNVVWDPWSKQLDEIANSTGSLHVFEYFPLHTRTQSNSVEDYIAYLESIKLLLADGDSKTVYWVKWKDLISWRSTELEGWIDDDVFVFSKFGNPWHGFLTAIDARQRKPLLTVQLHYWCR
jgi:hypothetical protein